MLIVRETWTTKPGQASKLAKMCKAMAASEPAKTRVMTDLIGNYNTVVMEWQVESLAEWEHHMNEMKAGKGPERDPELQEQMSHYTEMYLTGRREVFQVVE